MDGDGVRYKCDRERRDGQFRPPDYLRRPDWVCSRCGEVQHYAGHRCSECRRRLRSDFNPD